MLGSRSIQYDGPKSGISVKTGFDCSGMIYYLLHKKIRKSIPSLIAPTNIRHANQMFDHLGVLVHAEVRKPADLVFFSKDGSRPTHVGMYIGKNIYIHAPGIDQTEITITELTGKAIEVIPDGGDHRIYTKNPIGYKRLTLARKGKRWNQVPL